MKQNPLSHLRDIHLPTAISWWPLGMGWYFLIAMMVMICGAIIVGLLFVKRRRRLKKIALAKLAAVTHVDEVAVLLRQVAMATFSQQDGLNVAGLTGEAWLEFLDQTAGTIQFTQGPGRVLITAPYQKDVMSDLTALRPLIKQWIEKNA